MMKQKTHDYFTVLKDRRGSIVTYVSQLELSAPSRLIFGHVSGTSEVLFRKRIHHKELDLLPSHSRAGRPTPRVANASFVIKGKVAEMDVYHRAHATPLSKERRINTLILAAFDLKKMGCESVLTHVFIPGRKGAAGHNKPVEMKIDAWVAYLRTYGRPSEFSGQAPL